MKPKFFKLSIQLILLLHFGVIILTQCLQQKWAFFNCRALRDLESFYVIPFFEQNWSMFAPNPPMGKRYIAVKFQTKDARATAVLDLHEGVKQGNMKSYFSIDQRLIKYFSECYNDISLDSKAFPDSESLLKRSYGLQSIRNYARFVLAAQSDFLNARNEGDSIFCTVYLIDEPLARMGQTQGPLQRYYQKLNPIFISRKGDL